MFFKKGVLKNSCNFIKKKHQHMCFTENIAKLLRTAFLYRTYPVAASESTNA